MDYQHILLAIDFPPNEDNKLLAQKALEMAKKYQAKFSVLHVLEPFPDMVDQPLLLNELETMQELAIQTSKQKLQQYAETLGISDTSLHLKQGSTKREILEFSKQNQVDLIVVGSHGRHGLALLLGSTTDAILHGAECDVLAIYSPA